jgi:hypothetical protein
MFVAPLLHKTPCCTFALLSDLLPECLCHTKEEFVTSKRWNKAGSFARLASVCRLCVLCKCARVRALSVRLFAQAFYFHDSNKCELSTNCFVLFA